MTGSILLSLSHIPLGGMKLGGRSSASEGLGEDPFAPAGKALGVVPACTPTARFAPGRWPGRPQETKSAS